jgi:hypothetical protein
MEDGIILLSAADAALVHLRLFGVNTPLLSS